MDFTNDFIITVSILLVYLICFLGIIFYACEPTLCPGKSKCIENEKQHGPNDKSETLFYHEYSNNDKKVVLVYEELKFSKLMNNIVHKSAKLPTLDLIKKSLTSEIV